LAHGSVSAIAFAAASRNSAVNFFLDDLLSFSAIFLLETKREVSSALKLVQ
jgi:hypothetical protein